MEKWKSPPRRKKKKRSKKGNKNEFYVWSGNTWSGNNPNRVPLSVIYESQHNQQINNRKMAKT